ncbi:MAG: hypothetical protein RLZZ216_2584 [Cyanobacteriota bacterium]
MIIISSSQGQWGNRYVYPLEAAGCDIGQSASTQNDLTSRDIKKRIIDLGK